MKKLTQKHASMTFTTFADHVSQLAQNAQVAAGHGDFREAIRNLELAERSASYVDMHRRGALDALRAAVGAAV
jgi:hypothetical protein